MYYDAGAYTETDRVLNFDLAKPFDSATFGTVNVAVGLEYRDETFRIDNGEPNSFFIDPNLAAQGFGVGSNGFPGFQPGDAGEHTVRAMAAYIDLESNVSENLLLGGAMRYENYADFGNTLDGKVAARLQVADNLAIRGAVSTGFRVPTAGQANLRNVTTEFNMGRLGRHRHPAAYQSHRPAEGRTGVDAGGVGQYDPRRRLQRRWNGRDGGLLPDRDRGSDLVHEPVRPYRCGRPGTC